jgi:hypothetical protein
MQQIFKGKNVEPNLKDPQASHYDPNNSSYSPWGFPHSCNKVPKFEMHKFDGSNLAGWVSQMEQYFSLHDIRDDETKLHVGVLYLDQERWLWWQWHKKCYPGLPTWNMVTKTICAHFDRESQFLGKISYAKLDQSQTSSRHFNSWLYEPRAYLMNFTLNVLSVA